MDSLTQAALGASVSVALMGRRSSWGKAALTGAVVGTLPDLDVVIDHGDDLWNIVRHRAESHSLFFLTLLSPLLGVISARLTNPSGWRERWKGWTLACWLVLMTHVLIDWMTVYGTQVLQPFTDWAYAQGSIFIIDPLYTVPILIGLFASWGLHRRRAAWRWNALGLALSSAYLLWSIGAQQYVGKLAQDALAKQGHAAHKVVVTPTAFNTVLWRVLAVTPTQTLEGFYSLLDQGSDLSFTQHERNAGLLQRWAHLPHVRALERFTQGALRMDVVEGRVLMTDLRMGQEPSYTFTYDLGTLEELDRGDVRPERLNRGGVSGEYLRWVWQRMWGG